MITYNKTDEFYCAIQEIRINHEFMGIISEFGDGWFEFNAPFAGEYLQEGDDLDKLKEDFEIYCKEKGLIS